MFAAEAAGSLTVLTLMVCGGVTAFSRRIAARSRTDVLISATGTQRRIRIEAAVLAVLFSYYLYSGDQGEYIRYHYYPLSRVR